VTYYSVGCFRVGHGATAVLTDPFWSHVPLRQVALGALSHDLEEIDRHRKDLADVTAVVVGHSHYDHCMDLDEIAGDLHPDARIYGSQTLRHIFAKSQLPRPIITLNDRLTAPRQIGPWFYNDARSLRLLPIRSAHPNQWLCFHLYKEQLHEDLGAPPRVVSDYQEGITMAFLVDFLHKEEPVKRVYIQTSSTGYPAGFFPESILSECPVDVALLAMDCANIKRQGSKPSIIDFLDPKHVIFCHWEDFFRPKSGVPKEIVKVDLPDLKRFFAGQKDRNYLFPYWNSRFVFAESGVRMKRGRAAPRSLR
tara:strand:+ start:530 stop:1453 length:924 start_codon:yes stop_codon:yes gene_type:complete